MKITRVDGHILQYDLKEALGYSQQYYRQRTALLLEVQTDEGVVGWGECFGAGNVALANKTIVESVIQPLIVGRDPLAREAIWHDVYNALRDHGQKGMPLQSLSGIDIALWDIAGKVVNLPLYRLLGGACRTRVPVYGYGMMLRQESADAMAARFADEAAALCAAGFGAVKMKVGMGRDNDIRLAQAVHKSIGARCRMMVDANHCYDINDALYVGQALDELSVYWFEEPVAPEDIDGYCELRRHLRTNIAGGEAEFTRWGWRRLLEARAIGIAQPEVCGLGGISEYLKVLALAHTHFIPVVNHVWGSAISVATNIHLLAAMPPLPGGLHPQEPMLEFDTTDNLFRDELPEEPLEIQKQVTENGGAVALLERPGIGVVPRRDFLEKYKII